MRSESVLVRAVLDGDTIDVAQYGRVRLLGIDAPETGREFDTSAPFGHEARERLAALVLHHWVRLEFEGPRLDVYNRHLAYVMREDGIFVNATLVRDGLARVSARTPLVRLDELKRAEAEAQRLRRGMWGATPRIPATRYTADSSSRDRPRARRVRAPRVKAPAGHQPNKPRTTAKKKKKT
jgi:micrococcal nuclease